MKDNNKLFLCLKVALAIITIVLVVLLPGEVMAESSNSAELIVYYNFNGNTNDQLNGSTLTAFGSENDGNNRNNSDTGFDSDSYGTYWWWESTLARGGGFWIDIDQDISETYSIGVRFSFNETGPSWKKIIDYKDSESDHGFYFYGGKLQFYPEPVGPTTISNNQVVDIIATRYEDGTFKAYFVIDGEIVTPPELDVNAGTSAIPAVIDGKPRFGFFFDDIATTSEATSAGKVYSIKVWSGVLSEEDIDESMDEVDIDLSALLIDPGTLIPDFDPATTDYTANVTYDVGEIDVTATLSDENASLTINGEVATSGEAKVVNLNAAGTETAINVVVTAEDGDITKTYTITISRAKAEASGTQPLSNLAIGDKVEDSSWKWEFRSGNLIHYTKPIVWIVVAKNHYGAGSGVTLIAEELVGIHHFDNSTHLSSYGYNHWGESGTHSSATGGLRPWLNSTGIHSGEGLYQAFPTEFKAAVVPVNLPNAHFDTVAPYTTEDRVFVPSSTELGERQHNYNYNIGTVYPYFDGASDEERRTNFGSRDPAPYWTRSPYPDVTSWVRLFFRGFGRSIANANDGGVRPALNLASATPVAETPNAAGVYELKLSSPAPDPDHPGVGPFSFGLHNPFSGYFFLLVGDRVEFVSYGARAAGWIGLSGDWNGDGVYTPGVYDPLDGRFWLKGAAPETFTFGGRNSGRVPLAGDWNGDGKYSVGVYDHAEGKFYLRLEGGEVIEQRHGARGNDWIPVVASDGSGGHTVALYDPADSNFHPYGLPEIRFGPRGSDWTPVTGDWNGDGTYGVGLHHDGHFHLDTGEIERFGPRGFIDWIPVTGRWLE